MTDEKTLSLRVSEEIHGARLVKLPLLALAFSVWSPVANAQVGRFFLNVPKDTNLIIGTYNGVRSNTWADDALVDDGIESRNQTFTFAYAYVTALNGRSGGPGIAVPVSSMLSYDEGTNEVILDTSGIGDIALTFDYNLFGAPSLPREEFLKHVPGNYSGLHFSLSTPTGEYDRNASTNIGSNRWAFKTTLNYSLTSDGGQSWWDFYPSVRIFSDNDEFRGRSTLSQKPLYGFEAHYSRNVARTAWVSGGVVTSFGGATEIDGERAAESQSNVRLALGAGFAAWPGGAVILGYNRTVAHESEDVRVNTFMVQLLHKF
jgi:hypothetical protein